jgi:hypothetical protein
VLEPSFTTFSDDPEQMRRSLAEHIDATALSTKDTQHAAATLVTLMLVCELRRLRLTLEEQLKHGRTDLYVTLENAADRLGARLRPEGS